MVPRNTLIKQEKSRKVNLVIGKRVVRFIDILAVKENRKSTRVPEDHSCPPGGALVQGWESECGAVGDSLNCK